MAPKKAMAKPPPPTVDIDALEEDDDKESVEQFNVSHILDEAVIDGTVKYLVKWQGWPEEE